MGGIAASFDKIMKLRDVDGVCEGDVVGGVITGSWPLVGIVRYKTSLGVAMACIFRIINLCFFFLFQVKHANKVTVIIFPFYFTISYIAKHMY